MNLQNEERIKYYMSNFYDKEIIIDTKPFKNLKASEVVFCDSSNPDCLLPDRLSWCNHATEGWWNDPVNGEFIIDINCLCLSAFDCSFYLLRDQKNPRVNFDVPIFSITRVIGGNMILYRANFPLIHFQMTGCQLYPWDKACITSCWRKPVSRAMSERFLKHISPAYSLPFFDDGSRKIVQNQNVKWRNKKPGVVWRGTDSGMERLGRPNRLDLVKKYYDKYDIGFSAVYQESNKSKIKSGMIKPKMQPEHQSEYKYIISIEGNDSNSSFMWLLGSGSLILMQKPQFETWLMEGLLQEYVHYVPLSDPLDLEEKLDWCEQNQDTCEAIVNNMSKWLDQFLNTKNELKIHQELINRYYNQFKFI